MPPTVQQMQAALDTVGYSRPGASVQDLYNEAVSGGRIQAVGIEADAMRAQLASIGYTLPGAGVEFAFNQAVKQGRIVTPVSEFQGEVSKLVVAKSLIDVGAVKSGSGVPQNLSKDEQIRFLAKNYSVSELNDLVDKYNSNINVEVPKRDSFFDFFNFNAEAKKKGLVVSVSPLGLGAVAESPNYVKSNPFVQEPLFSTQTVSEADKANLILGYEGVNPIIDYKKTIGGSTNLSGQESYFIPQNPLTEQQLAVQQLSLTPFQAASAEFSASKNQAESFLKGLGLGFNRSGVKGLAGLYGGLSGGFEFVGQSGAKTFELGEKVFKKENQTEFGFYNPLFFKNQTIDVSSEELALKFGSALSVASFLVPIENIGGIFKAGKTEVALSASQKALLSDYRARGMVPPGFKIEEYLTSATVQYRNTFFENEKIGKRIVEMGGFGVPESVVGSTRVRGVFTKGELKGRVGEVVFPAELPGSNLGTIEEVVKPNVASLEVGLGSNFGSVNFVSGRGLEFGSAGRPLVFGSLSELPRDFLVPSLISSMRAPSLVEATGRGFVVGDVEKLFKPVSVLSLGDRELGLFVVSPVKSVSSSKGIDVLLGSPKIEKGFVGFPEFFGTNPNLFVNDSVFAKSRYFSSSDFFGRSLPKLGRPELDLGGRAMSRVELFDTSKGLRGEFSARYKGVFEGNIKGDVRLRGAFEVPEEVAKVVQGEAKVVDFTNAKINSKGIGKALGIEQTREGFVRALIEENKKPVLNAFGVSKEEGAKVLEAVSNNGGVVSVVQKSALKMELVSKAKVLAESLGTGGQVKGIVAKSLQNERVLVAESFGRSAIRNMGVGVVSVQKNRGGSVLDFRSAGVSSVRSLSGERVRVESGSKGKESLKSGGLLESLVLVRESSSLKSGMDLKSLNLVKAASLNALRVESANALDSGSKVRSVLREKTQQALKQQTLQTQRSGFESLQGFFNPSRIKIPNKPPVGLPQLPRQKEKVEGVLKRAFDVVTGGGKKVKTVARGLPYGRALAFGERYVDLTARASFRLVPFGSTKRADVRPLINLERFFVSKKSGRITEKNKYRIDTPFEKGEIPYKAAAMRRNGVF